MMRVKIEHVSKRYESDALAVDDVSFDVAAGEFLVLVGESGCGKTTLLKLVNRLIEPTAGRILLGEQDIAEMDAVLLRRSIGYVFQGVGLFPHMTVSENIAVTLRLLGWDVGRSDARVDQLLAVVRLRANEFTNRSPHELSGGQQQRIGFARALAAEPKVMLLDEPFAALDPLTRDSLRDDFRAIHETLSLTSILVTHDMTEALLLADRIIVMRDGQVEQIGTPHELLSRPADAYVEQLLSTPKREAARLDALIAGCARDDLDEKQVPPA